MAITKIAGELLESNLIRVQDLSFSGGNPALQHLLHVDVTNGRIGVKTDSPGNFALDVNGNTSCLLYTSPSPRDRQKSRMPSSA